jgi:uncharacterized heparinase superfamily protein
MRPMLRSTLVRARLALDAVLARFAGLGRVPDLLIAPQDLRTEDPTTAAEVLSGRFVLAGKVATGSDRSPFALAPPSDEWLAELHGFAWLRHLRASNSVAVRAGARQLFEAWVAAPRSREAIARSPEVTARRILSWLAQSPLLLEDADMAFYRRFMRALMADVARLRRSARKAAPGVPRLLVEIALTEAALSIAGAEGAVARASASLNRELGRQILSDGGHVSRNPATIIELLADLLPLRQAYVARSVAPAPLLASAIDRMTPMLRFFRHGDGAFLLANGMGPTPADLVASLLATDDTHAPPPVEARDSGYVRLAAGATIVIADVGAAPPRPHAGEAHAGALAFEFSDARQRIVVNCGMPGSSRAAWRPHARATAAHSTLIVADTFSATMSGRKDPYPVGPRRVTCELARSEDGDALVASHDGYARKFGVVHHRSLAVVRDGSALLGEDRVEPAGKRAPSPAPIALRFHLHPAVRASRLRDGRTVIVVLPDRTAWEFTVDGAEAVIEDSVFLAGADGPRRTEQIVVHADTRTSPVLRWQFTRLAQRVDPPRRPQARPTLPL